MATDPKTILMYSENAHAYAAHVRNQKESIYHSLYEKPAMYGLLPDLSGKKVISLGCGTGEDVQYLKHLGAEEVIGVDVAEGMIKVAKESYPDSDFRVMSIEKLDFNDAYFDFAFSSLTMHYLESWNKALTEVLRILKPKSHFLFSCFHPVNTARVVTENSSKIKMRQLSTIIWKEKREIEVVGDYLSRTKVNEHCETIGPVTTWHKSFGEIFAEIQDAGFVLENFIEPKPQAEMEAVSPADYNKLNKIPAFMIFKLFKPQTSSNIVARGVQ